MADRRKSYADLEEELAQLKKQLFLERNTQIQNTVTPNREEYLIKVFNSMGDPVFVKDHESRLLLVNNAFCSLFGLEREQIIGKTLAENVPPSERDDFLKIDKKVIEDGEEIIQEEPLTLEEGITRNISTRKTRFIDSDGNKYLIGVIRDLTERKKAEDALKESAQSLTALNEQKDKILSIIAHDLKGPISTILSFSDFMHDEIKKSNNEAFESYCTLINTSAKNAHILLDNLLTWARSSNGKNQFDPEKIDLCDVVQKTTADAVSSALIKHIKLEVSPCAPISMFSDKNMINAVLRNLIHNAIKFTNTDGEGQIMVKVHPIKDHVEISISDNGVGMSEEILQKLFSSSVNVTSYGTANEKGSGLGLNLCNDFVQKMGGKIWATSELGKGSEFTFSLPFKEAIHH